MGKGKGAQIRDSSSRWLMAGGGKALRRLKRGGDVVTDIDDIT